METRTSWTSQRIAASIRREVALSREDFAHRLVAARERALLSQEDLAHKMGMKSARQIIRWEGAHSTPYLSNIEKLAEALNIQPEELTGDPAAPLGLRIDTDRIARLEQLLTRNAMMLELLLDHHGIIPKDGQLPAPPKDLADLLDAANTSKPATTKRRRRTAGTRTPR